ncbi:MAG: hypothetical protein AAF385_01320 [Pseudomonadota bacterium]
MSTISGNTRKLLALAVFGVLLGACSGGSGDAPSIPVPPPPPPPPPPPIAFNMFVQDQFAATADNTDPVAVDDEDFAFDDDPAAFESLLQ